MRLKSVSVTVVFLLAELSLSSAVAAWSSREHRQITEAAVDILDFPVLSMPKLDFDVMVWASVQPDLMRPREMPLLRELEGSRHYIDLELLQGRALPESASEYSKLLTRLGDQRSGLLGPKWRLDTVGALPYALVESTERLAAVFAQLRRQPENANLETMAMHQAGIVAHYAQDLCQPLHTTLHHDGRARKDGSSPGSGIHRQVDGLLRAVSVQAVDERSQGFDELFKAVIGELEQSHAQVDRVYELSGDFAALQRDEGVSPALEKFGRERYRRAVRFTANLLHTAWLLSETIEVATLAAN